MKIGIEFRLATLGQAGGIALLLQGLLETLFPLYPEHEFVVLTTVFNRALLRRPPGNVVVRTLPLDSYHTSLDAVCAETGIDVLFRGYPLEQELAFPLGRQIFLIPDVQHEAYPQFFSAEQLRQRHAAFGRAVQSAGAIGTISEFARQTLLALEGGASQDIFLMSPGLPDESAVLAADDLEPSERALVPAGEFFLYPANLWPHKNHDRVVQAFARFTRHSQRPVSLVLTGHPAGWDQLRRRCGALSVQHLGFVRPGLLRLLFGRARALAFFSLYEGFGMPVLEAFRAGTPVLCSNTTSLPEVAGDAALTCDPTDIDAMCRLLVRIAEDDSLRADLASRGRQRLGLWTWQRSARNLMDACVRVARSSRPAASASRLRLEAVERPLVSIVTPSFNQGRFLQRTIDSVLGQSYPHIEHVVVDGGSKDDSVAILRSYGDRLQWTSEPDHGQTHAINKGFARTRGSIRAYLNSDDVLVPGAVEKVVEHFLRHPDWDLVYGEADYLDEDDHVVGRYRTADYNFAHLQRTCCICQPAAFWRTRIAEKVGPFDESLRFVMDYDYWLRIDQAGGRLLHVPDLLAGSRIYPQTKTLSCRVPICEEMIRVCLARVGVAHLDHFYGLWHHLGQERAAVRLLARVPPLLSTLVYLHFKWRHRHRYGVKDVVRWAGRRLARVGGLVVPRRAPVAGTFSGFEPSNWLKPLCSGVLSKHLPGQPIHLEGIAPVDMTLSYDVPGQPPRTFALCGGVPTRIDLGEAPPEPQPYVLRFSEHVVDPDQRVLSFLVQDTNLFSEHEAA
jgi:glycosyltransferase involved in cell wall biosynthesis